MPPSPRSTRRAAHLPCQQYTEGTIYNNSLVVECGDRNTYISYTVIYECDYSDYYTTGSYSESFAGESALTSAIDYVTNEDLPKLYALTATVRASSPAPLRAP